MKEPVKFWPAGKGETVRTKPTRSSKKPKPSGSAETTEAALIAGVTFPVTWPCASISMDRSMSKSKRRALSFPFLIVRGGEIGIVGVLVDRTPVSVRMGGS